MPRHTPRSRRYKSPAPCRPRQERVTDDVRHTLLGYAGDVTLEFVHLLGQQVDVVPTSGQPGHAEPVPVRADDIESLGADGTSRAQDDNFAAHNVFAASPLPMPAPCTH